MNTMHDFLMWYNNLDVQPFCYALEKMCQFWKDRNIDLLRQGISIPGITLTYPFMTLPPGIHFSLFDQKNKGFVLPNEEKHGGRPRYHLSPLP